MGRRGQVTVFIAIGLILVFIVGLVIYKVASLKKPVTKPAADYSKLAPVQNLVESCISSVGTEAILLLGEQGRIYPQAFIQSPTASISYFYYKGNGFFPARMQYLEGDVSRYITENLAECLDAFSDFDYTITGEDERLRVTTRFNQRDATLTVYYPVSVDFGDSKSTLTEFSAQIPFSFQDIYDLSRDIYSMTKEDPAWVDLDFLSEQPYEVRLIKITDDTLVYEITDDTALNNKPYTYRFAMKYNL